MKSIFIVDDCKLHIIVMKKMLNDSGYEVHAFSDGYALIKNLEKKKPHLIISDINMPELNGFELCKKIKSLPEGNDIPVVYVSSLKKEEVDKRGNKGCAVDFIQKPLLKESFLNIVSQKL